MLATADLLVYLSTGPPSTDAAAACGRQAQDQGEERAEADDHRHGSDFVVEEFEFVFFVVVVAFATESSSVVLESMIDLSICDEEGGRESRDTK